MDTENLQEPLSLLESWDKILHTDLCVMSTHVHTYMQANKNHLDPRISSTSIAIQSVLSTRLVARSCPTPAKPSVWAQIPTRYPPEDPHTLSLTLLSMGRRHCASISGAERCGQAASTAASLHHGSPSHLLPTTAWGDSPHQQPLWAGRRGMVGCSKQSGWRWLGWYALLCHSESRCHGWVLMEGGWSPRWLSSVLKPTRCSHQEEELQLVEKSIPFCKAVRGACSPFLCQVKPCSGPKGWQQLLCPLLQH